MGTKDDIKSTSRVWVNSKWLTSDNPKVEKWKLAAEQEKTVWGSCPDCGEDIMSGETVWWMHEKKVCMSCREPYRAAGLGHLDCCDLVLPGMTLEG